MTGSGVPGARLDQHGSQADRDEQGGQERHPAPTTSTTSRVAAVRMPPRWFVGAFWRAHRALLSTTRGRVGLWRPRKGRWGALQLTTTGRRTGRPRRVVVGYLQDGGDLVTMAMNGWDAPEPSWWLNLQAHPDATVRTRDGTFAVHAHRAEGLERDRIWSRWAEVDHDLEGYAARRPRETAVVVLRPRPATGPAPEPGAAAHGPRKQPPWLWALASIAVAAELVAFVIQRRRAAAAATAAGSAGPGSRRRPRSRPWSGG